MYLTFHLPSFISVSFSFAFWVPLWAALHHLLHAFFNTTVESVSITTSFSLLLNLGRSLRSRKQLVPALCYICALLQFLVIRMMFSHILYMMMWTRVLSHCLFWSVVSRTHLLYWTCFSFHSLPFSSGFLWTFLTRCLPLYGLQVCTDHLTMWPDRVALTLLHLRPQHFYTVTVLTVFLMI